VHALALRMCFAACVHASPCPALPAGQAQHVTHLLHHHVILQVTGAPLKATRCHRPSREGIAHAWQQDLHGTPGHGKQSTHPPHLSGRLYGSCLTSATVLGGSMGPSWPCIASIGAKRARCRLLQIHRPRASPPRPAISHLRSTFCELHHRLRLPERILVLGTLHATEAFKHIQLPRAYCQLLRLWLAAAWACFFAICHRLCCVACAGHLAAAQDVCVWATSPYTPTLRQSQRQLQASCLLDNTQTPKAVNVGSNQLSFNGIGGMNRPRCTTAGTLHDDSSRDIASVTHVSTSRAAHPQDAKAAARPPPITSCTPSSQYRSGCAALREQQLMSSAEDWPQHRGAQRGQAGRI
jgi:hypothetical protein